MDETQPLLSAGDGDARTSSLSNDIDKDHIIVDFDETSDLDNPIKWRRAYKRAVVFLLAFMAFTVTFACICVVPVANRIIRDLNEDHHSDRSASVLLVTIWEFGEAAGPLFIGPLSEMFGRYKVLNTANALFILATVLAACCKSTHLFIAARWLTGVFVASNVLNPAIVGDIYPPDQRGSAMSMIMIAPLIGGAFGPALSGAITEWLGWRQVLWIAAALALTCQVLLLCFFRETYSVTILNQRATALRKLPENEHKQIRTIFDLDSNGQTSTTKKSHWTSIVRPFHVFFDSFVMQIICLYGGMTFTYFYILSTTLPDILETQYNLPPSLTGLSLISFSIGSFVMVLICNRAIDGIYIHLRNANKGIGQSEFRLPLVIIGSIALPFTAILFGWATQLHLPILVLLSCVCLAGTAMMLSFLPVMAYIVDSLGLYSASGMTATIVTRCIMSTFFPLAVPALVARFGYGWGFTVLGSISLALAPIPMILYRYGAKWRLRSEYTRGAVETSSSSS